MRKKDYELIAKSLHQTFTFYFNGSQKEAIKTAMRDMADNFETEGYKFNRLKFLEQCGLPTPQIDRSTGQEFSPR